MISSMVNAAVFQYLNPILIGIVGANVQGSAQLLLATHAVNIWSYLVAKLVVCFTLVVDDIIRSRARQQNQENYTRFWNFIAFVVGSVSSVSLVSTFVSRSTGYIVLCTAWICVAIAVVVCRYGSFIMDGCRSLYYEILKSFFNIIWNRIKGNMSTETTEQPRPAV